MQTARGIPGPFLVVSVDVRLDGGGTGIEVTILPYALRRTYTDVDAAQIQGIRFMQQFPEGRKAGDLEIGDPLALGGVPYLWPWYVFEGAVGYLASWYFAEFSGTASVAVTVWELEEFTPAGAQPARDPYADAAARLAAWRALVERQLRAQW